MPASASSASAPGAGGVGLRDVARVCGWCKAGGSMRVRTIAASSRRISSQAVTFKQLTVFLISSPEKEACPLNLAERAARRYLISSAKELTVLFY